MRFVELIIGIVLVGAGLGLFTAAGLQTAPTAGSFKLASHEGAAGQFNDQDALVSVTMSQSAVRVTGVSAVVRWAGAPGTHVWGFGVRCNGVLIAGGSGTVTLTSANPVWITMPSHPNYVGAVSAGQICDLDLPNGDVVWMCTGTAYPCPFDEMLYVVWGTNGEEAPDVPSELPPPEEITPADGTGGPVPPGGTDVGKLATWGVVIVLVAFGVVFLLVGLFGK